MVLDSCGCSSKEQTLGERVERWMSLRGQWRRGEDMESGGGEERQSR